jgi:ABC-type oligopeptide transport system substrate-binding subunit
VLISVLKKMGRTSIAVAVAMLMLSPVQAADPNKVVRLAFRVAETGFDPAQESDRYSAFILEAVFDSPLTYDYLARPVKLKPNVVEAMPEVADNGATYTFRFKKGVYFAPDPAFKGKKREMTAEDFAYGIRRFYDPKLKSPYLYLFEGKIIGADEVLEQARKTGKYDYEAPVAGLELLDRYTLRIRLKQPTTTSLHHGDAALRRGGARSRRVLRRRHPFASSRDGPFHAQGVGTQQQDGARSESQLSRGVPRKHSRGSAGRCRRSGGS